MPATLAIDFGSKFIGIALVDHSERRPNRVLYAATLVVEAKPLNALVETRAEVRRLRRTRKTHRLRLRRLGQALAGVPNAQQILRFCRRRGFSHPDAGTDKEAEAFQRPRAEFFAALRIEVARVIEPTQQGRVLSACSRHLNEACRKEAELRPARFENRGPSRCNWHGCSRHVPKAENDFKGRLQQALFVWLLPVFQESPDRDRLRRSVTHWVGQLDALARARHRSEDPAGRKAIDASVRRVYRLLLARVGREAGAAAAEQFRENWREHYRRHVSALVRGEQSGRVRYCREHSDSFIDCVLAGKPVPNREDITEADLVSRKQQILFRRLWRLVEARLLPLAGGRIDRVVVERVAFDVLAGPFKARQEISQERASQMYWHGPQWGFEGRMDMLRAEFGGRCAYCGRPGAVEQVEHLLPRSAFPFDSYFNLLPACTACNTRKGARAALEAGMTVHDDAYEAYCGYLRGLKVPHVYHTIKKGLLNLLRRPATSNEAERRLAMLANDLVTVTASQRSPRPLARYLATRLAGTTGHRPTIAYRAGRHTALYRSTILPGYDKAQQKEEGDLRNHAVDAVILGCGLPSASALENKDWKLGVRGVEGWFAAVRAAAPAVVEGLGLPRVEAVRCVPYFEEELGGGYYRVSLSAFNWNRKRKATHVLDPFGQTAGGLALKRKPAAGVLAGLKDESKRAGEIEGIAHPGLRAVLQKHPDQAAERFVTWLQQTVEAGLGPAAMSDHPADQARRQLLQRFVQSPTVKILTSEEAIPSVVGVKCINKGSKNKIDVRRVNKEGEVFQRYQADPVVRELRVAYRLKDGQVDRSSPVLFLVNQGHEVKRQAGGKRVTLDLPPDSPLRGRPHGSAGRLREFLARWEEAFARLCGSEGVAKVFRIAQGCVIEKMDGQRLQFRNFDKGGEWMRPDSFRHIRRVHRSPFQVMDGPGSGHLTGPAP